MATADLARICGWRRGARIQTPSRDSVLRVMQELNVDAQMPTRWMDSRLAHSISLDLARTPAEIAWRERVWSAIYEEGRVVQNTEEVHRLIADLTFDIELGNLDETHPMSGGSQPSMN